MYKQLPLAISPDADATFANFFVAPDNQEVFSLLQQFPTQQQEWFIYLWGAPGCGITHLLEAVQNHNPDLAIQYLPMKELVEYPAEMICEGVEQLDLVCIDDVDVIAEQPQWQQQLFHLFNRLRENGKYLLVGSHQSPRQLPLSLADLQSRLQWGTVLQLQSLTEEEQVEALQFKAGRLGMELPDAVASYLLQRTQRSTPALFAMLKTLDQASLAQQRKLTIPFVKQVLKI